MEAGLPMSSVQEFLSRKFGNEKRVEKSKQSFENSAFPSRAWEREGFSLAFGFTANVNFMYFNRAQYS